MSRLARSIKINPKISCATKPWIDLGPSQEEWENHMQIQKIKENIFKCKNLTFKINRKIVGKEEDDKLLQLLYGDWNDLFGNSSHLFEPLELHDWDFDERMVTKF